MGVCKGLGIMTIDLNIVTRFYRRRWILFVLFVTVMSEKPKKKKNLPQCALVRRECTF